MKRNMKNSQQVKTSFKTLASYIGIICCLIACDPESSLEPTDSRQLDALLASGEVQEMTQFPTKVRDDEPIQDIEKGGAVNISFDKASSLSKIPDVNTTFVTSPGYQAHLGHGIWMPIWLSKGPIGAGPLGNHYHIVWDEMCSEYDDNDIIYGQQTGSKCVPVEEIPNLNRYHVAMFGNEWLKGRAGKVGGFTYNIDLTRIRVKGSVPITLMFKNANGNWFMWHSINPGYWNLPGALNIQEFHIRATSNDPFDSYSIDDIRVKVLK